MTPFTSLPGPLSASPALAFTLVFAPARANEPGEDSNVWNDEPSSPVAEVPDCEVLPMSMGSPLASSA